MILKIFSDQTHFTLISFNEGELNHTTLPKMSLVKFTERATALKSGEYQQTFGRIFFAEECCQEEYCSLGVLGRINLEQQQFNTRYRIRSSYLHTLNLNEIFSTTFDEHMSVSFQKIFVNLNDKFRLSFNEIADLLLEIVSIVNSDSYTEKHFN